MSVSRPTQEILYFSDGQSRWMVDRAAGVVAKRADLTDKTLAEAFVEFRYVEYPPVFTLANALRYTFRLLIPSTLSTRDINGAHRPLSVMKWHEGTLPNMFMTVKDGRVNFKRALTTGASPPLVDVWTPGLVVVPDQWTTWTVDVQWANNSTGWMRIYHENVLVFSHDGQSKGNGFGGVPKWTVGMRDDLSQYEAPQLSVYYDEVAVGEYPKPQGGL